VDRARILVVDDDDGIRESMKAILEDEGYNVDLAESGKEAILKTQKMAYNLVLLDIRLPDMEGIELLKLLKDSVPKIRKIMVTGYPSVQNAIAALNKGADAYLIKPVRLKKLLKTVKDQLKQQEDDKAYCEQKVAEFIDFRIEDIAVNHI
jgi:DNA-binding NtrC family response regulator